MALPEELIFPIMTRGSNRDRILKDANGVNNISDHLRNHIHLTNCIHLKNHMHKTSSPVVLPDKGLMRDLVVLQRSRSLRDPSASPRSWQSPSVVDLVPKDNVDVVWEGMRSIGVEIKKKGSRRLSGSSPTPQLATSKGEARTNSDRSSKSGVSGVRYGRRVRGEESSRKSDRNEGLDLDMDIDIDFSRNGESIGRKIKKKGKHSEDFFHVKTLSEQLDASDDMATSSNIGFRGRIPRDNEVVDEPQGSVRGYPSVGNRSRRRKFRGARRAPRAAAYSSRDVVGGQNEPSVASNSFARCSTHQKYHIDTEEERNVSRAPKNCGIPWNWSRIHDRGRNFIDIAGRSLSCGLSESKLRKGNLNGRDIPDMLVPSDRSRSSSFTNSDAEVLPLLVEASGSHDGTGNAGTWVHDYSGELGLFADHLLKQDIDSDLVSEARSGEQRKLGGRNNSRHQNLTQKYTPRTFRDLVGQNLVVQALSNAVSKRKVGLLYVFYGPHGTGKTSCARIFARALNCQSSEHPKPCGLCNSCKSHDLGKSRNIKEIGPVSSFSFENIMDILDNMIPSSQTTATTATQYRVFIFDDCDTLSHECWSAISKVIDRAPRRVVFILVCSCLDVLPHIIISRCQKFFFPKSKDADIIYTLQWIASKEDIEIDKDALKLIASRSDGSLRDAEMTLEQLSLLGQRISVPLVQELVGLISDEKLVDLLDLALSADTVNTVKNLRVIMETGVEPLALMSQLATVITDILAGSYDFTKERNRRKFFRHQPSSKEDMEKLRQALKTLSEAEKQLRTSNDKLTWLTAALLQLAPDQQYMLPPSSSADTSIHHSPLPVNNAGGRRQSETGVAAIQSTNIMIKASDGQGSSKNRKEIEEIWLEVLKKIQVSNLKEFLYREAKLVLLSFGAAPTVQLLFSSHATKTVAEKFRGHIIQAFESFLGSPVTIEIRCESKKDTRTGAHTPLVLPTLRDADVNTILHSEPHEAAVRSEIVEIPASPSPREPKDNEHGVDNTESNRRSFESELIREREVSRKKSTATSSRRKHAERSQSLSIVRSKVSLAHVIQQAEGCTQRSSTWSKRKAGSIAEKLEQENLRLESRSRSLLCWKASRVTRRKLSRLKTRSKSRSRSRRPRALLKLVSCGNCLSSKSPR